jgi:hypothetical protein
MSDLRRWTLGIVGTLLTFLLLKNWIWGGPLAPDLGSADLLASPSGVFALPTCPLSPIAPGTIILVSGILPC